MNPSAGDADQPHDLVGKAQHGDVGAFEALYRMHSARVFALCLRLTGDRDEAATLLQDAFVRAWERLATFRGEAAFPTWLHRLTLNCFLEESRKSRRREARVSVVLHGARGPDATAHQAGGPGAVVHAFHHGTPVDFPVSGTAEGLVGGQRRSVSLEFGKTSRPGVFALRKQWPTEGTWTLVIAVTQGPNDAVHAIVDLSAAGTVASVRVPTREERGWILPGKLPMAEVDASLRARARGV